MGAGVTTRLVVILALAVSLFSGTARGQASEGTHSPHGNLAVPCQNCHTANGWKPIRAVPEFDHNQTRYPLRGMHASVACTSCHVKMVFTDVGQRCQDCHADIHRRQLGANCEQCHTVRGWQVATKDIEQHNNRFPLTGAHAAVDCDACHKAGAGSQFQTMSTACFSCHQSDFTSTNNPSHVTAKFSTTCESCHTTDNWLNVNLSGFDHSTTGFILTGGHADPPRQCTDCHVNNNYNLTSMACFSCHQKDFASATSPVPHAGFPTTCEQCHDVVQWTDGKFDHSTTGFTLTGMHTVPPRQCTDCHVSNNYTLNSTACVSCHLKDFQGTTEPNHVQSNFSQTCEQCHDTTNWMDATFNHSSTGFVLTGQHTIPPRTCSDCHNSKFGNYNIANGNCVNCHLTDFQNTTDPNHAMLNFSTTCDQCHTTAGWSPVTSGFDHNNVGFPLTGMHTVPPRACSDCHTATNGGYALAVNTCVSCHVADFQGTTNPNHQQAGIATTCETCHNTGAWTPATFDHSQSGFLLTNAHAVPPLQCSSCHNAQFGNYNIANGNCVNCHQTDYNNAVTPVNHVALGFPTTCQNCHDTVVWTDGKFDHSTTGFLLTNAHADPPRQCTDCHNAQFGNYNIASGACANCHQTDYNNAITPVNHVQAAFPLTCETCHDTVVWTDGKFDHSTTGFLLTNAHADPPRQCADCHNAQFGNYNIANGNCVNCHMTDYNNATTPVNHVQAGFPTTCATCHDTVVWTDGKFDHSTTGFLLTNGHADPPRQCTDCHNAQNGNYAIANGNCVNCHQTDYNNATTPVNHVQAGFPTTCATCHDTVAWTDGTFNHSSTGFLLTNAHADPPRQCTDCHNAQFGNYNIASGACVNCHLTDYNNATTPVAHSSAGFPTTCDTCHDTIQWTDGKFDHSTTGFPLTNSHTVPPRLCTDCHVSNNYSLNSTLCYSCHQKDYTGTTNPAHASAGFPTTCDTCHDTVNWTDSTFNHNNTGFALVGMHTVPPRVCTDCHVNNNYGLNSNACSACHQTDYNGTTNPAHSTTTNVTFFPIAQCGTCHSVSASDWTGASFPHTTYTQFSVNHGNAGGNCSTCHINGSDYSVFQCTGCHGNNNASNFQHPNVNGYVYNSTNCYHCHASGGGG